MRLEKAIEDREAGRLIDADDVFAGLSDRLNRVNKTGTIE